MASSERLHAEVEIESLSQERRGPGLSLRQARERCRLSVASIADTLHLEPRVIEALEADDYSRLPPIIYVRGYLGAYARLVNLPVADVLQSFERVGLEERSRPLTCEVSGTGGRHGMAGAFAGSSWLLTAAFAAVLISGWMFWTQGQATPETMPQDEDEIAAGATTPARAAAAGADIAFDPASGPDADAASAAVPEILEAPAKTRIELPALSDEAAVRAASPPAERPWGGLDATPEETAVSDAVPVKTLQQDSMAITPAASSAAGVEDRKPAGDMATTANAVPESTPPQPTQTLETLKVDASGESWVDVQDAGGQRLVYGLLEQGDSRRVAGRPPFEITIGDASQVVLRHEGARVDLGPYTQGKVARFTLTATRD